MFRLEMFDGTTTYMFPNGAVATPEAIRKAFPAVDSFPHVLEVNGNVLQAVMEFKAVRQQYGIPDSETDENALMAMSMALTSKPVPQTPTPEERLAAAAEFQNVMSLPDAVADITADDTIARQNYQRGMWSKSMLNIAAKKGVITEKQRDAMIGVASKP